MPGLLGDKSCFQGRLQKVFSIPVSMRLSKRSLRQWF